MSLEIGYAHLYRCHECGGFIYHKSTCKHAVDVTAEQWAKHADRMTDQATRYHELYKKFLRETHLWQGKHAMVCRENNSLRKRIRKKTEN